MVEAPSEHEGLWSSYIRDIENEFYSVEDRLNRATEDLPGRTDDVWTPGSKSESFSPLFNAYNVARLGEEESPLESLELLLSGENEELADELQGDIVRNQVLGTMRFVGDEYDLDCALNYVMDQKGTYWTIEQVEDKAYEFAVRSFLEQTGVRVE